MLAVTTATMPMNDDDFDYFRRCIETLAGISMSTVKRTLIESRLRTRLLACGFASYGEYRAYLASLPRNHDEWQLFINELTTNKTNWFREVEHYALLTQGVIPRLALPATRPLRVWSAACSTGEEPYTLAMVLAQHFGGATNRFSIMASDLDTEVLATAANGVYLKERIAAEVPQNFHSAFVGGKGEVARWAKVKNELRQTVRFTQLNLTQGPWTFTERFDIIFCRNVLIYFSAATVRKVVNSLFDSAGERAALFIGHSESLQDTKWRYAQPSLYIKGDWRL